MIDRRLKTYILIYLWIAIIEDVTLFVISWVVPSLWFRVFHHSLPATAIEIALLRRNGGQWAAFALGQAITLWRWRKAPEWLAVSAGIRFSDLFTDLSYLASAPSLTLLGRIILPIFPLLNLVGIVLFLHGYRQMLKSKTSGV